MDGERPGGSEQPEKGLWVLYVPMVLATVLFFGLALLMVRLLFVEKNLKPNEQFNLVAVGLLFSLLSLVSGWIAWRLILGRKSASGFMISFPIIRGVGICIFFAAGYFAWKGDLSGPKLVLTALVGLSMIFAETSWEWFMPEPEKLPTEDEEKSGGK